jgi:hypothetical protein
MALFSPAVKWSCSLDHVVSALELHGTSIAEFEVSESNQKIQSLNFGDENEIPSL